MFKPLNLEGTEIGKLSVERDKNCKSIAANQDCHANGYCKQMAKIVL